MITNFTDIKNSFISAYSYNKMLGVLTIVFNYTDKRNNNIVYSVYSYMGIPNNIVKQLADDPHPGNVFITSIRNTYPNRRLNSVEYKYSKNA